MAGNHAEVAAGRRPPAPNFFSEPCRLTPPFSLINRASLAAFNTAYFHRPLPARQTRALPALLLPARQHPALEPHLRPARLLPVPVRGAAGRASRRRPPRCSARSARAARAPSSPCSRPSARRPSPGMLSFPLPGATLALDFPNGGAATLQLFERLDAIVARSRRPPLPGQGRAHARRAVPRRLSALAGVFATCRPEVLVQLLAARHGVSHAKNRHRRRHLGHRPRRRTPVGGAGRGAVPRRPRRRATGGQRRRPAGARRGERRRRMSWTPPTMRRTRRCWRRPLAALGGIDIALIAHGTLPDQRACETDRRAPARRDRDQRRFGLPAVAAVRQPFRGRRAAARWR